jgi:hypothetical protein
MDAPMISIKLKGLHAIHALCGGGKVSGLMNMPGVALAMGMKEMELKGLMAKNGLMMRELEMEGRRMIVLQPSNGTQGAVTQGAIGKSTLASKSSTVMGGMQSVPQTTGASTEALGPLAKAGGPSALSTKSSALMGGGATKAAAAPMAAALSNGPAPALSNGLGSVVKGSLVTKSALVGGAAAKSAVGPGVVALQGMGWGLVLGALGPWLALGSLGLAATGVYFYVQARRLVEETHDFNG